MSWRALASALVLEASVTLSVADLHRANYQRTWPRHSEPAAVASERAVLDMLSDTYSAYEPWILSLVGALLVGFSGVLPLLVIPLEAGAKLRHRDGERRLRLLLSFAVGGLVGDVFLHLLPEAMRDVRSVADRTKVGLWVIMGIFFFLLLEMIFSNTMESDHEPSVSDQHVQHRVTQNGTSHNGVNHNGLSPNGITANGVIANGLTSNGVHPAEGMRRRNVDQNSNGFVKSDLQTANGHAVGNGHAGSEPVSSSEAEPEEKPRKEVAGYLNLLANSIDNFTHGLAIGGSFLASTRLGLLTTFAILIHEIPHEVGDFAILLKSGFSRWEAAKAQLATATLGITGAVSALLADDPKALGDRTAWILPFTAGGFIHIALVGVLPEVCKERQPLQCLKQGVCMLTGVLLMLAVNLAFEH